LIAIGFVKHLFVGINQAKFSAKDAEYHPQQTKRLKSQAVDLRQISRAINPHWRPVAGR
jgi:hypothetical protein